MNEEGLWSAEVVLLFPDLVKVGPLSSFIAALDGRPGMRRATGRLISSERS